MDWLDKLLLNDDVKEEILKNSIGLSCKEVKEKMNRDFYIKISYIYGGIMENKNLHVIFLLLGFIVGRFVKI